MNPAKYRFGIALSGGGARGIAHIGVLDALHKYGIQPEIISGTSMGALVGVFYAAGYEPAEILSMVKESSMLKLIKWQLPTSGLFHLDIIQKLLVDKIKTDDFAALKKPFSCAVSNLNSGKIEIKSEGELFRWVMASASIPVIFEPQVINGTTYVDGGLFENLPAACIRKQSQILIGVHVNHNGYQRSISGFKEIAERTFQLAISLNVKASMALCDFVIDSSEMQHFNTFDFKLADEIYHIGYNEAEKKLPEILDSLDKEKS